MQISKFYEKVQEVVPPCWMQPDLFDPDIFVKLHPGGLNNDLQMRAQARNLAKSLCAECPLQKECLEVALANREPAMIWGGYTPEERLEMLKGR